MCQRLLYVVRGGLASFAVAVALWELEGVREGVKAVPEEVDEEEMSEHLDAGYRELTPPAAGSATLTAPATW